MDFYERRWRMELGACTLSLSAVDKKVFVLLVEIFVGISGLVACLFPRVFNDQNLELLQLNKNEIAEPQSLFLMHQLGGMQLVLVLISFLSRTASTDEGVSRNVMTMWAQRLGLDVIVYLKFLIAKSTVTKYAAGKATETFDFSQIPVAHICIFLVMLGLCVAAVVHLFRWPVFRAQICMSTHDRTNFHLLLLEIFVFFVGCLTIALPEFLKMVPGFDVKLDINTLLIHRTEGMVLLIMAVYIHNAQSFYDSRDKAPVFQAIIFGHFLQLVHHFVYLYKLPGNFACAFFTALVVTDTFVVVNCILGLISALNGRPQFRSLSTGSCSSFYHASQSSASELETEVTEEDSEEDGENEVVVTYRSKSVSFQEERSSSQESGGSRSPARSSGQSGGDSTPERRSRRKKK